MQSSSRAGGSGLYAAWTRSRRRRVLLAEDDEPMRRMLARWLALDGYEVDEVCDGNALRMALGFATPPYDLVLTDLRMPGASGLEVIERALRDGLDIPVILMTAFGDEVTHLEAERVGAVAVFDKPFDVHDVRTAVAYFIRRSDTDE